MSSGNSQIIKNYSFNASEKKVVFSDYTTIALSGIKLITNVVTGTIIYQFNDVTKNGSVSGNTLTLTYDTTSMSNSNTLMIVYEDPIQKVTDYNKEVIISRVDDSADLATNETIDGAIDELKGLIVRPGQKSKDFSIPVAIASDQNPILDTEKSGTLVALNATHLRLDVSGYTTLAFVIKGTFTATMIFEGSVDGFTFFTITADTYNLSGQATTATVAGQWFVEVGALKAIQIRCSAYTSGVVNITSRLSIAPRQQALSPGNNFIGSISSISTICCITGGTVIVSTVGTNTPGTASTNLGKAEDLASANADVGVASLGLRTDTPVANDNVSATADYTQIKLSNFGATWVQPLFTNRSDTYTVTGNGTTVDISLRVMGSFSIQVVSTAGPATTWDIRLEGSNDNVNFTQILAHTNVDGNGLTKANTTYFPCLYFRSRCVALTLGTATNVITYIVGSSL